MVSRRTITGVLIATVVVLLMAGCAETRQTIRTVDQHPSTEYATVQTAQERVVTIIPGLWEMRSDQGVAIWGCQQDGDRMRCNRICDAQWDAERLCEPALHGEFGRIEQPTPKITIAQYQRRLDEISALEDEVDEETAEADDDDDDGSDEEED